MVDFLSHPLWQGVGVIIAIVFGLIGFYYAGRQRFWLYLMGAIVVFIAGLAVGSYAERNVVTSEENVDQKESLSIAEIPFSVYAWSKADIVNEQGWAGLSVVNNTGFEQSYRLDYYLPDSSTQYSGAGLTFKFDEPFDMSTFNYISIDITFKSVDDTCYLLMFDISDNFATFPLGRISSGSPGVYISNNTNSQTYKIPLDGYFQSINKKVVRELACAVDTTNSTGKRSFTINNISFLRK